MNPILDKSVLSYNLLSSERQQQWRHLGIFPETFDSLAVTSVWGLKELEADAALGELVTSSLIEVNRETGRYRLHDLAGDFARHHLQPEELQKAQLRHARYYYKLFGKAEELFNRGGRHIHTGLQLFTQEWENIRAGQRWSADQAASLKDAAELCSGFPLMGPGLLDLQVQPKQRIAWLERALEAARTRRNRANEGKALGDLGNSYRALGEVRRAIEFHEQCLAIVRELGDRCSEGEALSKLGLSYSDLGEIRTAIELYEQHLSITQELKDRRGEGLALGNLGIAYWALKDCRRAIELYEPSLTIAREFGDRRTEGRTLCNLGLAYADLGEFRRAIEFYRQHLAIAQELGDRRGEGHALGNMANAYRDLGDHQDAIDLYEKRLAIARDLGDRRGEAIASWNLGETCEKEGQLERAADLMQILVDYEHALGHAEAEKHASKVESIRTRLQNSGTRQKTNEER